jgi:FHS family L-fucose permease-like MFS transporter
LKALGVVLGTQFGTSLLLDPRIFRGEGRGVDPALAPEALGVIIIAFALIACIAVGLATMLSLMRRRIDTIVTDPSFGSFTDALRSRWAIAGAIGIFFYVGNEVAIGSLMIGLLSQPDVFAVSLQKAGWYLGAFYWGSALVGCALGSLILLRVPAATVLICVSSLAILLAATVVLVGGPVGGWAALSIGLLNSVMFPTIFTITLTRSTADTAATSGLLCTAIIGGALVPPVVGAVADHTSIAQAFILPILGYVYIVGFALRAVRADRADRKIIPAEKRRAKGGLEK